MPADQVPPVRGVRPARSDRHEPAPARLLLQDLRDVAFPEHRLERNLRFLRAGLERGDDRAPRRYERVAQLSRQVQKRLKTDRPGEVRDDHAVQERSVDDVNSQDRPARGPGDPKGMSESRLRVGGPVEPDRNAGERHVTTTPA